MTFAVLRAAARHVTLAIAVASLAGCSGFSFNSLNPANWFSAEKPKPAELTSNPATMGVREAWTARIGAVDLPLSVNVQGNAVVLASSEGAVVSLDAASGRELWRASAGAPIVAGVGSDGRVSAVVTQGNDLVAFEGGKELWRQHLTMGSYTAPFVAGARVFLLQADRTVVAFDGQTGRRLWTYTRASTEPLVLRHSGVMLAVGDQLVVGQTGRLAGLNPLTGSPRWEAAVATPRGINDVERLVDLVGTVYRNSNVVCARAFQAAVGCVDAVRGATLWTKPASGAEGVAGDNDYIFGSEADGRMVAWKQGNGDRAWTTDLLLHRGLTAPLSLGRAVVVGDSFGCVHLLSRDDGKLMNRLATGEAPIVAPPVLAANTLVVVTKAGVVHGYVSQ